MYLIVNSIKCKYDVLRTETRTHITWSCYKVFTIGYFTLAISIMSRELLTKKPKEDSDE